jgi:hypothetical protein
MGHVDAAISANTANLAGIVTIWITLKSFGIRTSERGFKSMKTINFNPCISHTYDDRACNPCIIRTYEKDRGWGAPLLQNCTNVNAIEGKTSISGSHANDVILSGAKNPSEPFTNDKTEAKHPTEQNTRRGSSLRSE